MRTAVAIACVLAASAGIAAGAGTPSYGTVFLNGGAWSLKTGVLDKTGVAWANYTDQTMHPSGFGQITVTTNPKYNDTAQMFAAGYVEGALTQERVWQHANNLLDYMRASLNLNDTAPLPPVFEKFYADNSDWVRANVASNSSALWTQVGFVISQLDGLLEGYNAAAPAAQHITPFHLHAVNAIGDFLTLGSALMPGGPMEPEWGSMTDEEMKAALSLRGHCSALVSVTGNFSTLFNAQVAWFTYSSMLRISKHYDFSALHATSAHGRRTTFSSYPGVLSSLDDFYMNTESQLGMVQTTNGVMDHSLLKQIKPQSLLAWQRVRVANDMATSGKAWCDVIASYNSGTYNNAYLVTDFKLFTKGAALQPNTLYICEQMPGYVAMGDFTRELERGYVASYNVPVFPSIYNRSGFPAFVAKYKDTHPNAVQGLDYQLAPRAKIFRRDAASAVDMPSLKALMRSNLYPNDPYFEDTPTNSPFDAICSRGDLIGYAGGCYDGKVTSSDWIAQEKSAMINGPTSGGGHFKPFEWTSKFASTAHMGQPSTYDFEWEDMIPDWAR